MEKVPEWMGVGGLMEIVDKVRLVVLTKEGCAGCVQLKRTLKLMGFKYEEKSEGGYLSLKPKAYPFLVVTDLQDNILGYLTPSSDYSRETIEEYIRRVLYGEDT